MNSEVLNQLATKFSNHTLFIDDFILPVFSFVIGLISLFWVINFSKNCIKTRASILSKETHPTIKKMTIFKVEFNDRLGRKTEAEIYIPEDLIKNIGDTIEVLYNPKSKNKNDIMLSSNYKSRYFFPLLSLVVSFALFFDLLSK